MATKTLTKDNCGFENVDIRQPSEKQKRLMPHVVANLVVRFRIYCGLAEDGVTPVLIPFTVRGIKIVKSTKPENEGQYVVIMPNFTQSLKDDDADPSAEGTEKKYGTPFYPTDRLTPDMEKYVIGTYLQLAKLWAQQNELPDSVSVDIEEDAPAEVPPVEAPPVEASAESGVPANV